MRAVIDTNVLISALLSPNGAPRRVIKTLASHQATLLFSDATFNELAQRLARPRFNRYRTARQMVAWLDWLAELGEWVAPATTISACRNPDDDKFLAVAVDGEAQVLVTGDGGLLELTPFEGIPILTPAGFLACRQPGLNPGPA